MAFDLAGKDHLTEGALVSNGRLIAWTLNMGKAGPLDDFHQQLCEKLLFFVGLVNIHRIELIEVGVQC